MEVFDPALWKVILEFGAIGIAGASYIFVRLHIHDDDITHKGFGDRIKELERTNAVETEKWEELRRANHESALMDKNLWGLLLELKQQQANTSNNMQRLENRFSQLLGKMGYPPTEK